MKVSRLVGGILCLVLAGFLAVLYFVLPGDRVVFMVGDQNVGWLPALILGVLGVFFLATAGTGPSASVPAPREDQGGMGAVPTGRENADAVAPQSSEKMALNKRLESIGWGFFLVMLGGSFLVPHDIAPNGLWTIGVGLIMLGLNVARYYFGIRMSGFTTVLGILAIATGIAELLGFDLLGGALLLIILGIYVLLKPYFDRRQIFGKVEQS